MKQHLIRVFANALCSRSSGPACSLVRFHRPRLHWADRRERPRRRRRPATGPDLERADPPRHERRAHDRDPAGLRVQRLLTRPVESTTERGVLHHLATALRPRSRATADRPSSSPLASHPRLAILSSVRRPVGAQCRHAWKSRPVSTNAWSSGPEATPARSKGRRPRGRTRHTWLGRRAADGLDTRTRASSNVARGSASLHRCLETRGEESANPCGGRRRRRS